MPTNYDNIPDELKQLKQFVTWRAEETSGGKPTKVPYQAAVAGRQLADVTNPAHWASFDAACAKASNGGGFAGIGFCFSPGDDYAGIDLDASTDPAVVATQSRIAAAFDSYSERSPSGSGLHIIIKANLLSGRRRSSVELYSRDRFFTMTGDVFNPAPIRDHQALAEQLWSEMGKVAHTYAPIGTLEDKEPDATIVSRALAAVNGDKFQTLQAGLWANIYPSQSEADFAFIDMLAFYTQSRNQIVRIFRASPLGQRDKAQRSDYVEYMLNRAFDRLLPPLDIEGLENGLTEAIARRAQAQAINGQHSPIMPTNPVHEAPSPYTIPPGLLGELARFFYEASPRPVPEIALAAAIGLMSGVTGRAYNVSGVGLNQYVLLLAQTGTGKEAMASGIDKLIASIENEVPAVGEFIGPSEIASGQALLKYLGRGRACFLSVIGEFGLKMQILADERASSSDKMLKRIMLDLYNKSGNRRKIQPSIYSQKENDTASIIAPAVTLLGESTPETFYSAINESVIADGLLPRFITIEYSGNRPPLNNAHTLVWPSTSLRNGFANLAANCLKLNQEINTKPMAVDVRLSDEAATALAEFDRYADEQINGTDNDVIRHLWNRAHVKALKLSAIVAVGCNPFDPIITIDAAEWAMRLVRYDVKRIFDRFRAGDFGSLTEESKQANDARRIMREYITLSFDKIKPYHHSQEMHARKVIPYAYMNKRLVNMSAFRLDKIGATNALKRTINVLIESGFIDEMPKSQVQKEYNTSQRTFAILDKIWLFHEKD